MNSSHDFPETQEKRAQWFKSHGGVNAVVEAGLIIKYSFHGPD